ncbi:hypothetical protein FGO68_gene13928 [Halteria grandinella]|uniref:Protein YOP1 n=1 Tax=Halteria grandinella TaxID=5974 RepID=A0A8J8SYJ4_HALGN|nr:hypothetical protein FGO68_gene13928 [Halteria grandinella]
MDVVQQRLDLINKEIERIAPVKNLAKQLGVPAAALVFGPIAFLVLLVAFGVGASFFTTLIGIAYPTFKSIIALESPSADDDKQWLTYWSIFGFLVVIDDFAGFILSYIPYYYFIKVCVLIWLFNPATQGATTIYNNAVKPLLTKFAPHIKEISEVFSQIAGDVVKSVKKTE